MEKQSLSAEWTRAQRYKKIEEYSRAEIDRLEKQVAESVFRQTYHIQPKIGLLNDPNGFCYFNGAYHLFYQWFPMGPIHGIKYWYHLTSTDLVHWQDAGIGLSPDTIYDSHGVFSGSGYQVGEDLYLMYTGNVRTDSWARVPHQLIAKMNKEGQIEKLLPPVIEGNPAGYTEHFRDPKIWQEAGHYYAIIGAQRTNETGACVLYQSDDALHWTFIGEVQTTLADFGYMWECPDYFETNEQGVLVFSPQGLAAQGDRYQNIYQTGYLIGEKMDLTTGEFVHGAFHELDAGFDFYATQTTLAPDGRRILTAWMGLPEIAYPSDRDNWANCLTIPRELTVRVGRLYQQPVRELAALRTEATTIETQVTHTSKLANIAGTQYELDVTLQADATCFGLILRAKDGKGTKLYVDRQQQKLILDRSESGVRFAEAYGTKRQVPYTAEQIRLHIFVDTSSIEVFVNEGETTFTARIFTEEQQDELYVLSEGGTTTITGQQWSLKNVNQALR